jgi:REP-associated tyrosine transposase
MSRPIRIEFGGALYHVTSRGDRREAIYEDDTDREQFLSELGEVVQRFNWHCHAYCLMSNYCHTVIATLDANLSRRMRQLNGVFMQWSNDRHRRTGRLFQGRFKAILVDADSYLLKLSRYVVLNLVRAGTVRRARDWKWSSYRATTGEVAAPEWLDTDGVLSQFGSRRKRAVMAYERFVREGIGADSLWRHLNHQVFRGDGAFVTRALERTTALSEDINISRAQRRPLAPPLDAIARKHRDHDSAMRAAWATGQYSYSAIR